MNLGRHLTLAAARAGERVAVVAEGGSRGYAELDQRARRLEAGLAEIGLRPGDRVALWAANRIETLEIMFACFRAGLVLVPIHFKLSEAEVAYILKDSGASLVLTDAAVMAPCPAITIGSARYDSLLSGAAADAAWPMLTPSDPAWLFYTSGTTGRPKGATLSHGSLEALILGLLAEIDPARPDDVFLHAGPMSHASGLCALAHVARATTHVIVPAGPFAPERVIDLIQRHRVTTTFMVPTMIARLLDPLERDLDRIRSLRTVIYGGAPMPVAMLERAQRICGTIFVQLYGQGEAPHVLSVLTRGDHSPDERPSWPARLASAGRPCVGVELRILDEAGQALPPGTVGEVVARGGVVMNGYWNNPTATAEALRDGWLHTGDLGYLDPHGYLFLTDRKKELIISGGMNVYSREVEDVLHRHPAVQEAAVVGIPDPEWGEMVKAFVVLRPHRHADAAELVDHCRRALAPFKRPKAITFLDELPKGSTGKILKRALKADLSEAPARS